MKRLEELCSASRQHRRLNPPAMDAIYSEKFEQDLAAAITEALASGADQGAVYALVSGTAHKDCVDMPPCVDAALLQNMTADVVVDAASRQTLLHNLLGRRFPPPLSRRAGDAGVSLRELLDRGATPDLQDALGNTALHLLVVRIAKEKTYPDLEPEMAMNVADQDFLYRDDERIDLLEGLGGELLRRGWSLDLPNTKGRTVRRLLQLSHHIAEAKRGAVQRGLEQSLQMVEAMAAGNRRTGQSWPDTGTADVEALQRQTHRQLQRIDRMQAVLAQLGEGAPPA